MQPNVAIALIAAVATLCAAGTALLGVWLGHRFSRQAVEEHWLVEQKLKVYSDVLRAVNDYSVWITDVSEWRKFGSQSFRAESESTLDRQNEEIAREFHSAYAIAPLFVSDDSVRLFDPAKPLFYYHSDPLANFEGKDLDNTFDALERVRGQIEFSARADLRKKSS